MSESVFQTKLILSLREKFPGCIILKNDPNYLQGFPDLIILFNDKWAALEVKDSLSARKQPNQHYYVDLLANMSYASFISPEIEERIINELQRAFGVS